MTISREMVMFFAFSFGLISGVSLARLTAPPQLATQADLDTMAAVALDSTAEIEDLKAKVQALEEDLKAARHKPKPEPGGAADRVQDQLDGILCQADLNAWSARIEGYAQVPPKTLKAVADWKSMRGPNPHLTRGQERRLHFALKRTPPPTCTGLGGTP